MRFKTLEETSQDLLTKNQSNQNGIEEYQSVLSDLVKKKNDLILVSNSTLGSQQKKLDKLKSETAYLEQRLEEHDNIGKMRVIFTEFNFTRCGI